MERNLAGLALAVGALIASAGPALADDPHDPAMRSAAARARDHEMIRQLNLGQLAAVRERDAGYAAGWSAVRAAGGTARAEADQADRTREHQQALAGYDAARADYAAARADYESRMARWRDQVEACNAGNPEACR